MKTVAMLLGVVSSRVASPVHPGPQSDGRLFGVIR